MSRSIWNAHSDLDFEHGDDEPPFGTREEAGSPAPSVEKWTQAQAVELCRAIEVLAPKYGCHVALTGGTLYHFGARKDADILFYRIRQCPEIDVDGLMEALRTIGVTPEHDYGWCYKATFNNRRVDFFFPERDGGAPDEYGGAGASLDNLAAAQKRIKALEAQIAEATAWSAAYEREHGQFKATPGQPVFMISF